jgi:hypothetical protein
MTTGYLAWKVYNLYQATVLDFQSSWVKKNNQFFFNTTDFQLSFSIADKNLPFNFEVNFAVLQ